MQHTSVMRQALATLLSVALLTGLTMETAAAKGKARKSSSGQHEQSSTSRSSDAARAQSVDPAGNYRGYPDWARWAFSPKGGGSSIR